MVGKIAIALATMVIILLPGAAARATIVGIHECRDIRGVPLPSDHWSFDYDSQVLTIAVFVHDTGPGPSGLFPPLSVVVTGQQDTQSTLTIVENITNKTGVSFTGYELRLASPHSSYSEIVAGSFQVTGSAQVHQHSVNSYELAWSEPIPDEGTFTTRFDVLNYMTIQGHWEFGVTQTPVPEPATIALLGLGGLALLRKKIACSE